MLSSTIECECVAQSCPSMRDSQINRGVFANVKSASRKAFPTSNRRRDEPEISLPHSAVLNVYVKAGCTSPLLLNESGKRSRLSSRIPSKGNTAEKKPSEFRVNIPELKPEPRHKRATLRGKLSTPALLCIHSR